MTIGRAAMCTGTFQDIVVVNASKTYTYKGNFVTVSATALQMAWNAKDVTLWSHSSSASTLLASTVASQTITSSTTVTASVASSTQSSTPVLTVGAKAGLGVASLAAFVFLVVILVILVRRRRVKKATASQDDQFPTKPELSADSMKRPKLGTHELAGNNEIYEASGRARPGEADNMNVRAELEGGWQGNEVEARPDRT